MAASRAARLEAQAASVVKFLPARSKTLATRPAITFDREPGIVSSVTGMKADLKSVSACLRMASCCAVGRVWNSAERRMAAADSGQYTRRLVDFCSSPPMALPRMMAQRLRSKSRRGRGWPSGAA